MLALDAGMAILNVAAAVVLVGFYRELCGVRADLKDEARRLANRQAKCRRREKRIAIRMDEAGSDTRWFKAA